MHLYKYLVDKITLPLALLLLGFHCSYAEGTKQIRPTSGDAGYLQIHQSWGDFALFGADEEHRLHIRICNLGEVIYYGFDQPNDDVNYRIVDPTGQIVVASTPIPSAGSGYINTYAEAVAGPQQIVGAGGYDALSYTPAMTGDYYIEFSNQASKREFENFDITVASASNEAIDGRLWSMAWQFTTRSFANPYEGELFIYTDDGIVSSIDFNGMQPYVFVLSANRTGCTNTGDPGTDRQSIDGNFTYPQYKIFLNDPDSNCFPTGTFGTLTAPTTLEGCAADSFCVNVSVDKEGYIEVLLDLNGVLGYQPGTEDLILGDTVELGTNCIPWDGTNGLGNPVASGTSIGIEINYFNGLTHIPIYDVEQNTNGFLVRAVRPPTANPSMLWDDTQLASGTLELTGCTNPAGCHQWPVNNFGNKRSINTWWYSNTVNDSIAYEFNTILVDANASNAPGSSNDSTVCVSSGDSIPLNGSVVGAAGGVWSGGSGTFYPNDSVLNASYFPTQAEITGGGVRLILTSIQSGICPTAADTMELTLIQPPAAQAGANKSICPEDTEVQMAAKTFNALSTAWYGGTGIYAPDSLTLNTKYTLSQDEIADGGVTLYLVANGNALCPAGIDSMRIDVHPSMQLSTDSIVVRCIGEGNGSAIVSVSGGTPNFTYQWDAAAGAQTTDTASNLTAGTYSVTVTDDNTCELTTAVTVTESEDTLTSTVEATDVTCYNGDNGIAIATAEGGTADYTFLWDTAAGSQVSDTATGLQAGTYFVEITDAGGCTVTDSVEILEPDTSIYVSVTADSVNCFGGNTGSATINAFGGTPGYTYLWDVNAGSQTTPTATGLASGNYVAWVRDTNNCGVKVVVNVEQPLSPLSTELEIQNVSCNGASDGSVNVLPSGGTPGYSYLWGTLLGAQSTDSLLNLSANTYQIVITDANGCSIDTIVSITQPDALSAEALTNPASCNDTDDGFAWISVTGGTPNYSFLWDTAAAMQANDTAFNLPAGSYTVTITDSNNCETTATALVEQPDPILIQISSSEDSICSGTNVNLQANATGGTGTITYSWNQGLPSLAQHTVNPLTTTNYKVFATDDNRCISDPDSIDIHVKDFQIASLDMTNASAVCHGSTTTIGASYNGLVVDYTIQWSHGLGSTLGPHTVAPKDTTTYYLTITDACGNEINDSVVVNVHALPVLSLPDTLGMGCEPFSLHHNGAAESPDQVNYYWELGDGNAISSALLNHTYYYPGTYQTKLTAVSEYGCTTSDNATVYVNTIPRADAIADPMQTDIKHPDVEFRALVTATRYQWDFGDGKTDENAEVVHTFQDTGIFDVTLTVTSENGCENDVLLKIDVDPFYEILVPNAFTPNSNGPSGGEYDINSPDNDVFFPLVDEYIDSYNLEVYNRWGELIFKTNDVHIGWDGYYRGVLSPQGVYAWRIEAKYADGTEITKVGDITLIR